MKQNAYLSKSIAAYAITSFAQSSAQTTIQLLHASDLEGGVPAIIDAPNFAAVVEALEDDAATANIPSLLLSAGDDYLPGPFFSAAEDRGLRTPLQEAQDGLFELAPGSLNNIREGVGRVDLSVMNIIGFDASAVGNHEFDAGTSTFASIIRPDIRGASLGDVRWLGAQFPYLSANLDFSADGGLSSVFTTEILPSDNFRSTPGDLDAAAAAPKIAEATIIEKNGEFFGVIGATTPIVETITSTGEVFAEGPGAGTNEMADLAIILQPVIDSVIASGVDKVILVTHLQQLALEEELVPLLSGVDLVIAGGSDSLLADETDVLRAGDTADREYPIVTTNADGKPALIVSTDGQYSYVGRLVVEFDAQGDVVIESVDATVSGAFSTSDDGVAALWGNATDAFLPGTKAAAVRELTSAVEDIVTSRDGTVFGRSEVFLEGRRAAVRTEETNLGNLTADANLAAAQAIDPTTVISLKNGGGIRAEIGSIDGLTGEEGPTLANPLSGKEAGEISQLDLENTLRFDNGLTLLTLSTADVLAVLEHAVAESGEGATPGRFPQIGGLAFSFDPVLPAGERVQTVALKNAQNETIQLLVENGQVVGDPERTFRVVTLGFLADGGDGYPYPDLAADRLDTGLGEQEALADFLAANFTEFAFAKAETSIGQDGRIQNLDFRSDSVAFPIAAPENSLRLNVVGRYETGIFDEGAAEIITFDPQTSRLFLVNSNDATVDILDLSDPENPVLVNSIDIQKILGRRREILSPNSVAVCDGLVAVAVARNIDNERSRSRRGYVAFFDTGGNFLTRTIVGHLPDMLIFTPDKRRLVVANEGEPTDDYRSDPEGTVSILNVGYLRWQLYHRSYLRARWGRFFRFFPPRAQTANFRRFNRMKSQLVESGVRVFGPGATVAQDLEPEFVAITGDSRTAYVSLQENNAVAVVDLWRARVDSIEPLGLKDFTQSGFDASNRDDSINIQAWPVSGMYQPDAIALFEINGTNYLISSNEGDARDYEAFSEEVRLADLTLDPEVFPDFEFLQGDDALGRLRVTNQNGDLDGDGDLDQIFAYGGRSFSIWEAQGRSLQQVYDSGADLEKITASLVPGEFNSNNDENDSFDSRSDDKGPEPEGVEIGVIDGRTYAFIGLERVGGIMVYDVSDPEAPVFLQYVISRDFTGDAEEGTAGDLGPEGLEFVPAEDSPNGKALLLVANEVSGSVTVMEVE